EPLDAGTGLGGPIEVPGGPGAQPAPGTPSEGHALPLQGALVLAEFYQALLGGLHLFVLGEEEAEAVDGVQQEVQPRRRGVEAGVPALLLAAGATRQVAVAGPGRLRPTAQPRRRDDPDLALDLL